MFSSLISTINIQLKNNKDNAIIMQDTATQGDFRSPIRAHFQSVPEILKHNYWRYCWNN